MSSSKLWHRAILYVDTKILEEHVNIPFILGVEASCETLVTADRLQRATIHTSIYLSIYLYIYLWLYSPLLDLGRLFSFLIILHSR
jgi:hypothetical protein